MSKFLSLLVLAMALMLAGCNTWHGFGQDLENAGEKIKKAPNN